MGEIGEEIKNKDEVSPKKGTPIETKVFSQIMYQHWFTSCNKCSLTVQNVSR